MKVKFFKNRFFLNNKALSRIKEEFYQEFILEEFTEASQKKSKESLDKILASFGKYPFDVLFNLLNTFLKLQSESILACLDNYNEFVKISEIKQHRHNMFSSYFCLFEKIFFLTQFNIRDDLMSKFKHHFEKLDCQKMYEEFLGEIMRNFFKFKTVPWL